MTTASMQQDVVADNLYPSQGNKQLMHGCRKTDAGQKWE